MNQKGFANIILVVVVIAIVAVAGYFMLIKKSGPPTSQPTPSATTARTQQPTSPSPANKQSGVGGGGSDEIYYETGAYLNIGVDTLINENPVPPGVTSKKNIVVDGVDGTYYVFTEPSLYEGQLLGASMIYKGNRYSFRFGYNSSTYPQGETVFTNILNSFRKVQTSAPTASNTSVVIFKDKYGWYSVEIPKDWKVIENIGARGVSLSSVHIESPDWKSHVVKPTE